MKITASLILPVASALDVSPIAKCLEILGGCETKIIKEGEDAQKVYAEFSEWCEENSANVAYEIKTGKLNQAELQAVIAKETSNQEVLNSQVEDVAAGIAQDEKDLKEATKIRGVGTSDFKASESDLTEIIDTLNRAIGLVQREMSQGASTMQLKGANSLKQVFSVLVQASALNTADATKLTAFVQSSSDDDDSESGVYESHSGGIVDTLQSLLDRAEEQLDSARKQERAAGQTFAKLKQSLEDSIKYANKDLSDAKTSLATSQEAKATADGDLAVTQKDLNEDISTLSGLHHTCLTTSQDYEVETNSRSEELKALATAKGALQKVGAASFLQISSSDEPPKLAVHFVRNLARKQKDQSLAQLASRMESALRLSSSVGSDPFAKVKALLSGMLTKLEDEAVADASHKAYCDKELAETRQKKAEKSTEVDGLSTKIEQKSSASAKLKEEVSTLQEELSKVSTVQYKLNTLRQKENADYVTNKAETEQNLEGVKFALKVLRDYYSNNDQAAHNSQEGAASGVIAMLETVESDLSKNLFQMERVEEDAVAEFEAATQNFAVRKTSKNQDVKYKIKEHTGIDKAVSEHTTDREGVQTELDATDEALRKLEEMCIAKPEPYADRVARREAEISGLKDALGVLESESAFVQRSAKHLRVARRA